MPCRYGRECYSFMRGDGRCQFRHPPPQHPQLHPQQPVLSMSMSMGQTIGDLSDAPSYLVRIGVPKDQADALLVVYPGKPLRAALAFAHQNPSGPVFFLCGSDRHSARDSPRLWEDPDDTNNTCFSIFDLFEGIAIVPASIFFQTAAYACAFSHLEPQDRRVMTS